MMLCQYSYFTTIQHSNAGTATVLQYTGPAMILAYLCLRARRRPKMYELAALCCAMIGTFIMATHGNIHSLAIPPAALFWGMVAAVARRRPKMYELAALCCAMIGTFIMATHGNIHSLAIPPAALFWGMVAAVTSIIYTLQPAELMKRYSTLPTLGWGMFLGGLILMVWMRPWRLRPVIDAQSVILLLFIVLFGTICAFTFYLSGVRMVGAANASMLACVEPVSAALLSALWLKVKFLPADLLGFAFVLSTVFIISVNNKKEEQHGRTDQI